LLRLRGPQACEFALNRQAGQNKLFWPEIDVSYCSCAPPDRLVSLVSRGMRSSTWLAGIIVGHDFPKQFVAASNRCPEMRESANTARLFVQQSYD